MTHNIIIGKRSFLSLSLKKINKKNIILSTHDLSDKSIIKKINQYKKVNLVFNNFYPSSKLNFLKYQDYDEFKKLSIQPILDLFKNINVKKINKIIYTSSSSVYGLIENLNSETKDKFNRELYSSFKLACEKIIINFANKNNKKYYILRLFNTYGNKNDHFSFIEKLLRAKNKTNIFLINNGSSIRDFIHLNDIAKIYNQILEKNIKKGIYDLGTGKGSLIKDIVELVNINKKKITKINQIEEIQNSVADINSLIKQIGNFKFVNLNFFIKKNIKNYNKIKIISERKIVNKKIKETGVVIYGGGHAGKQIFKDLITNNENVLFIVDDDVKKQNTIYENCPIISYQNLLKLKNFKNIKTIYLAIPSLGKGKKETILKKIKNNFFDVRFLPEKKFLLSDQISLNDLNINEINNILNRKQIKIKKIKKLNKKVTLVTGAGGTIGSEICRQLIQQKVKKIIAIDKSEIAIYNLKNELGNSVISYKLIDINDQYFLEKLIIREKIDFIFHAAAYKHVNILEKNIFPAVKNNIFSTYNVCYLAKKHSCEMIFISTDKAANPKSILGYSKRFAEKICEYFNTFKSKDFIKIVRFGNVFGSSGSAITSFLDQINMDKPVKITHMKASRFFMTIMEACHLVLQTTEIKSSKKIFVLNMGRPLNIFRLAKDLGKIKSKINPNYQFRYEVIGLQPGEKLHETIVDKQEIITKHNSEIFLVKNKKYKINNFIKLYQNLIFNYQKQNEKNLFKFLSRIGKI